MTEDTASAKPGQANVKWIPSVLGAITVVNTTPGHNLPVPDEMTTVCMLTKGHCPTLYGFYPAGSPICTLRATGQPGSIEIGFDVADKTDVQFGPPGDWCAVAFGSGDFGKLKAYGGTKLPVAGTVSANMYGLDATATLEDEALYPALAKALTDGPKQWVVSSPTWSGETTSMTPAGCGNQILLWSSSKAVCRLP